MARRKTVKRTPTRKPRVTTPPVETMQPMQNYMRSGGPSNILIILLVVVSFLAGYLFFKLKSTETAKTTTTAAQQAQATPAAVQVTSDQIKKLFTDGYMHFGNADKKVLFVEISDPSCPFCHMAGGKDSELAAQSGQFKYVSDGGTYNPPVPEMKKLVDSGQASFVMLYSNGHGNGEMGAKALYCAYEQGKFWDVHDLLMSNAGFNLMNNTVMNDKTKSGELADFLAPAMDPTAMKSCLDSGKYDSMLTRDQNVSQQLGFSGTPDFFVNTTNYEGAQDYKTMEPTVTAALGG